MRLGTWKDAGPWHESGMKRIADHRGRADPRKALHAGGRARPPVGKQRLILFADTTVLTKLDGSGIAKSYRESKRLSVRARLPRNHSNGLQNEFHESFCSCKPLAIR